MIEINIPLFGMAGLELDITDQEVKESEMFRLLGNDLQKRLQRVADIVDILLKHKVFLIGETFNLTFHVDMTEEQAIKTLNRWGIDEEEVFMIPMPERVCIA
jgi:hypothetical protein